MHALSHTVALFLLRIVMERVWTDIGKPNPCLNP
jgi:hypothetical protein